MTVGAGEPGQDLYFGQMMVGARLGRNWSAGVQTTGAMGDPARSPARTPHAPEHG